RRLHGLAGGARLLRSLELVVRPAEPLEVVVVHRIPPMVGVGALADAPRALVVNLPPVGHLAHRLAAAAGGLLRALDAAPPVLRELGAATGGGPVAHRPALLMLASRLRTARQSLGLK